MKDATYLESKIKSNQLDLKEYYQELCQQIQELNPVINALVEYDDGQLLSKIEKLSLNKDLVFSGIPIPLKMLQQQKSGWKSTNGSRLLANTISNRSSNFTNKLESVGFIPFGQTNAPEFGLKNITDPLLYGEAKNPWNLQYSPGGSSGGAAAAVASGIFPIAAASDGGGSIRIPASFCGLIGLKPTRGSMPTGPSDYRNWQGTAIDFAITVSMRDTEKLFYALKGNDKASPYHAPSEETKPINKSLKIAYFTDSPIQSDVSDEAKLAVKNILKELNNLGHETTEISFPLDGISLLKSYYLMNGAEISAMFSGIQQIVKRKITIDDMELMTWGFYQYGERISAKSYINALRLWDYATAKMEELFLEYDLLLTPTTAYPAPKLNQDFQNDNIREELISAEIKEEAELEDLIYRTCEKGIAITPYTQLANLTGQPAISLPTHITKANLPLGIQFMASKGREDLLFYIGKQLEEEKLFKLPKYYQEQDNKL